MSKHFKMYIMISDIIDEKRVDLAYPVQSKEVAVISMFSDNVQYWLKEPMKVLLAMGMAKKMLKGVYTYKELNTLIGLKLKSQLVSLITSSRRTSWKVLRRWLSAWTNSTTLTTWKTEDLATSYLDII